MSSYDLFPYMHTYQSGIYTMTYIRIYLLTIAIHSDSYTFNLNSPLHNHQGMFHHYQGMDIVQMSIIFIYGNAFVKSSRFLIRIGVYVLSWY